MPAVGGCGPFPRCVTAHSPPGRPAWTTTRQKPTCWTAPRCTPCRSWTSAQATLPTLIRTRERSAADGLAVDRRLRAGRPAVCAGGQRQGALTSSGGRGARHHATDWGGGLSRRTAKRTCCGWQRRVVGLVDPAGRVAGFAVVSHRLRRGSGADRGDFLVGAAPTPRKFADRRLAVSRLHPGRGGLWNADRRGRSTVGGDGLVEDSRGAVPVDRLPLGGDVRVDGLVVLHGFPDGATGLKRPATIRRLGLGAPRHELLAGRSLGASARRGPDGPA